jgi:hypothetical protein
LCIDSAILSASSNLNFFQEKKVEGMPALKRQRQADQEVNANLGYIAVAHLIKEKKVDRKISMITASFCRSFCLYSLHYLQFLHVNDHLY